jgi:hypothetical protein
MRARWYDAANARFITRDRLGPTPALPSTLNSFGYANGNPELLSDPSGLRPADEDAISCTTKDCGSDASTDFGQNARQVAQNAAYWIADRFSFSNNGPLGLNWNGLGFNASVGAGCMARTGSFALVKVLVGPVGAHSPYLDGHEDWKAGAATAASQRTLRAGRRTDS